MVICDARLLGFLELAWRTSSSASLVGSSPFVARAIKAGSFLPKLIKQSCFCGQDTTPKKKLSSPQTISYTTSTISKFNSSTISSTTKRSWNSSRLYSGMTSFKSGLHLVFLALVFAILSTDVSAKTRRSSEQANDQPQGDVTNALNYLAELDKYYSNVARPR